MKNPVCFVLLNLAIGLQALCAQEGYWLKIQPKAGAEYRFQNNINISVENGGDEPVMTMNMMQSVFSKITASSKEEVALVEKLEKVKGSSTSMGRTFDFDTSNPMAGHPTMNAQMESLIGKDAISRIKPNGSFVAGSSPLESLMGTQSGSSDFRPLTGNVRFPDYALKIGDSWTVIDTVLNQGMTNITTTVWTLQGVKDDLAILSSSGTGTITGTPPNLPDAKIEGTLTTKGSAKIELSTGVSRESALKIDAKMNMAYAGQTQEVTSVTESASKLLN